MSYQNMYDCVVLNCFALPVLGHCNKQITPYIMVAAVQLLRFGVHAVWFARRFGSHGGSFRAVRFAHRFGLGGSSGSVRIDSQPMRIIQSHGSIRFGSDMFIGQVRFGSACRFSVPVRFHSAFR